jgi:hypothetical protein
MTLGLKAGGYWPNNRKRATEALLNANHCMSTIG